jgi:hypothetical protein
MGRVGRIRMSAIRTFDFNNQLVMSTGTAANRTIGEILLETIPGSVRAIQALSVHDKQGVDWWLDMKSGERLAIDCKIRYDDPIQLFGKHRDDVALETWSVVEKKVIGWTLDETKKTDYIFWLWKPTGRWCVVPFHLLVKAFKAKKEQWMQVYPVRKQKTVRPNSIYHSECVYVNRREMWAEIYLQAHGNSEALREARKEQPDLFGGADA